MENQKTATPYRLLFFFFTSSVNSYEATSSLESSYYNMTVLEKGENSALRAVFATFISWFLSQKSLQGVACQLFGT